MESSPNILYIGSSWMNTEMLKDAKTINLSMVANTLEAIHFLHGGHARSVWYATLYVKKMEQTKYLIFSALHFFIRDPEEVST